MNTDAQLKAIYDLKYPQDLNYEDWSDITTWKERACANGADWDTSILTEKSRERITAIFKKHFV